MIGPDMWHIPFSTESGRRLNTALICRPSGHHQLSRVTRLAQGLALSARRHDRPVRVYQRLPQPTAQTPGTGLEITCGLRTTGRITRAPDRHKTATGPKSAAPMRPICTWLNANQVLAFDACGCRHAPAFPHSLSPKPSFVPERRFLLLEGRCPCGCGIFAYTRRSRKSDIE